MINGFPYWQFHNDKWLTGKISAMDLDAQGLFLQFCMAAWSGQGMFNICSTSLKLRFRKPKEWLADTVGAMLEVGIIEKVGNQYRIKFIDDQLESLHDVRQKRSKAGKESAKVRALLNIEDSKENSIVENSKEEKSSVLKSVQHEFNTCSTSVDFDMFWKAYPRKVGKKAALSAWKKAKDKPDAQSIVESVQKQAQSEAWQKDGGQYIPNPATWINQGRWDDVLTKPATQTRNCI
jgi:hypothetical protein